MTRKQKKPQLIAESAHSKMQTVMSESARSRASRSASEAAAACSAYSPAAPRGRHRARPDGGSPMEVKNPVRSGQNEQLRLRWRQVLLEWPLTSLWRGNGAGAARIFPLTGLQAGAADSLHPVLRCCAVEPYRSHPRKTVAEPVSWEQIRQGRGRASEGWT